MTPGRYYTFRAAARLGEAHLLTWGWGRTLKVWSIADGQLVQRINADATGVAGARVLLDGSVLTWGPVGSEREDRPFVARCWAPLTGDLRFTIDGHRGGIRGATQLPSGEILTFGRDAVTRIWNSTDGSLIEERTGWWGDTEPWCVLAETPDYHYLLDTGGRVRRLDHKTRDTILEPSDAKWLAGSHDAIPSRLREALDLSRGHSGSDLFLERLYTHQSCPVLGSLRLKNACVLTWGPHGNAFVFDGDGELVTVLQHDGRLVGGALRLDGDGVVTWDESGDFKFWDGSDLTFRHSLVHSGEEDASHVNQEYVLGYTSHDRLAHVMRDQFSFDDFVHRIAGQLDEDASSIVDTFRDSGEVGIASDAPNGLLLPNGRIVELLGAQTQTRTVRALHGDVEVTAVESMKCLTFPWGASPRYHLHDAGPLAPDLITVLTSVLSAELREVDAVDYGTAVCEQEGEWDDLTGKGSDFTVTFDDASFDLLELLDANLEELRDTRDRLWDTSDEMVDADGPGDDEAAIKACADLLRRELQVGIERTFGSMVIEEDEFLELVGLARHRAWCWTSLRSDDMPLPMQTLVLPRDGAICDLHLSRQWQLVAAILEEGTIPVLQNIDTAYDGLVLWQPDDNASPSNLPPGNCHFFLPIINVSYHFVGPLWVRSSGMFGALNGQRTIDMIFAMDDVRDVALRVDGLEVALEISYADESSDANGLTLFELLNTPYPSSASWLFVCAAILRVRLEARARGGMPLELAFRSWSELFAWAAARGRTLPPDWAPRLFGQLHTDTSGEAQ